MSAKNILKYPGSKWTIAAWIVSHFPAGYEHMSYLEPYFGSGAVFFSKNRSVIETLNDIDSNVVNLFRVARDYPHELANAVYLTPWAREEYQQSYLDDATDHIEKARRFLVRMWQAIGAKSSTSTGWRKNVKGVNGNVPRFHTSLPDDILQVADRLKHAAGNYIVQIEKGDAVELIKRHNTAETLIYADPPYMLDTRKNVKIYKHEYTEEDHVQLLEVLMAHPGKVLLSGYDNELYNSMLSDWYRAETQARAESAQMRIEVVWCNYQSAVQGELWGKR